jgi:hypothetical protein
MKNFLLTIILWIFCILSSIAQDATGSSIEPAKPAKWSETTNWEKRPRLEDHFWRKKVRYRIDMLEKVNKPFKESEPRNLYDDNSKIYNSNKEKFSFYKGVIDALLANYALLIIPGYNPDTLDDGLEFTEFQKRYKNVTSFGGEAATADAEGGDEEGDDDGDWDSEAGENETAKIGAVQATVTKNATGDVLETQTVELTQDFSGMSKFIDVIEDRIFEKNKSDMYYKQEYIILSAKGVNSEVPLVAFRYEDIKDIVLNNCLWKNRFNDAEYRTIKEVFELRLFNSYLTVVGLGQDYAISDINDSEKKRLQMIEYEHNLFEF